MSQDELKKQNVEGKVDSELGSGLETFISKNSVLLYNIRAILITVILTLGIAAAGIRGYTSIFSGPFEYTDSGLDYAEEFGYDGDVNDIGYYLRGDVYSKYVTKELTPKQMELYEGFLQVTDKEKSNNAYGILYRYSGSFMDTILKIFIAVISCVLIAVSPFVGLYCKDYFW